MVYTLYNNSLEFPFQYTAKKIKSNFLVLQSHWVITECKCLRTDPENVLMHYNVLPQGLILNPE